MANYLSPGVYVESVPPLSRPIAGVGTSTPGFIGILGDTVVRPIRTKQGFEWRKFSLLSDLDTPYRITSWNQYTKLFGDFVYADVKINIDSGFTQEGSSPVKTFITGTANPLIELKATYGSDNSKDKTFAVDETGNFKLDVTDWVTASSSIQPADIKVQRNDVAAPQDTDAALRNFRNISHAVYGFFNNGGTSVYVQRITADSELNTALGKFARIDEISMVAAPGLATTGVYSSLTSHAEKLEDRVAILDSISDLSEPIKGFSTDSIWPAATTTTPATPAAQPPTSDYAAFYFPWIQVVDPAEQLTNDANKEGLIFVPPSGHVAGIYARTDATRGVFKAPANEVVRGAVGLRYLLSRPDQDAINPIGINLIRNLVGAPRIWGARTVGGDANGEFKYISTRRYFNYLRKSIDEGTQFVVFEPNSPALWERIKRTVGAFLLNEWRSGALFGSKPEQAFFVRCDDQTNPAEVIAAGRVVTEIGIAIVKPAEFVIFQIQQQATGS